MVAKIESTKKKKKKIHFQDKKTESCFLFPSSCSHQDKTAKPQAGLLLYTKDLRKPSSTS